MTERIESVTATELRIITAEILDQIRIYREPIAVTRQGKTIAYIVPINDVEK